MAFKYFLQLKKNNVFFFKKRRRRRKGGEDTEQRKTAWARPGSGKELDPYLGNDVFPGIDIKVTRPMPAWRDP